ncbi:MAG TPA: dephospho-CoA kinase [Acidimicrobiia bacterium]|nr:dephospho-CoA kinase [Acidimicrobiia bacterium]
MRPRQRVVVAGGIGSGKSTVISALSELGWSVINADQVGHEVLMDPDVTETVAARWPQAVREGAVNRSTLAKVVFADPGELVALEGMTHPLIVGRIESWVETSVEPLAVEISVLKVAAPEWGPLVIVSAPESVRRERALERGMKPADVEARMASQPSDSELLAAADIVIDNQGTVEDLAASVRRFDQWARSR